MVISLATATQESHDFNRGRCQGVPSNKVLFVDDKYDTVAQAIKHGFCAMTTIEVMTKMYEKYGEKH